MLRRVDRLFRRYQKTGDPRALGAVFDHTAQELLRVGLHVTRDLHRAEDLLQSTFLTAIEKADQYDPKRSVLPWLIKILANRAREWSRKGQRETSLEAMRNPVMDGDEGDRAGTRELARACDDGLEGLAEPYRHVLILHLRHGLSGVQIARAHGRSESTVRNQIARGLKLLRSSLPALGTSAAVIATTGGRGLAAVRREVLAKVPRATGAAMTGTSVSIGALLMSKKLMSSLLLLAVLVGGTVLVRTVSDVGIPTPAPGISDDVARSMGQTEGPHASEASADPNQPPDRVPVDHQAETGSLRVELVIADDGGPASGKAFEVWRWVGERGREVIVSGSTAADGLAVVDELPPGTYFFEVFQGRTTSVRILAGQQESRRIEIPAGWQLQGRVVDRYGRPVRDAEVRVNDRFGRPDILVARSQEDGSFSVPHLTGTVWVWAMIPGLQPSKRQELEDRRRGTAEVRLVLGGTGRRLSGIVEDEQGQPVPRSLVCIAVPLSLGSHWEQHELHSFRAGDDGRFAADWLPAGRLFVGAVPPDEDHARATSRWVEMGSSGSVNIVMRLGDGATVAGRVVDLVTGQAVQGVQISARTLDDTGLGPFGEVFGKTDEAGHYSLQGLIEGVHKLSAYKGNLRVESEIAIGRGQEHRWDAELARGGTVRLRVLGPDGEPLSRWTIELRKRDGESWSYQETARTDGGGLCEFIDLREGEYMVRGLVVDFHLAVAAFERRGLIADGREVTIRVSSRQMPSARLHGRIANSRGEPVLDANVSLHQDAGFGSQLPLEVDLEGRFETTRLPPGRYSISARSPSIGRVYAHGLYELEAGQEMDVGDLVLGDPATLEVRLVAEDSNPITEPVLILGDPREVTPGATRLVADEVDGVYRADGLQAQEYELRFFAANALPRMIPVELVPGQTRRMDVRVVRARPVVLEIRLGEHREGSGFLNGQVTVTDSKHTRVLFHRLWGYFDDYENRIKRIKLALAPGEYEVDAWQYGGKRVQVGIRVSDQTTEPFVIDLR